MKVTINSYEKIYPDYQYKTEQDYNNLIFTIETIVLINRNNRFYKVPVTVKQSIAKYFPQLSDPEFMNRVKMDLIKELDKQAHDACDNHVIVKSFKEYLLNNKFEKHGYWYKLEYHNHISDWFATEIYVNYVSDDKPIIICFDSAGIDKEVIFRGMIETEEDFDRVFKQLGIAL